MFGWSDAEEKHGWRVSNSLRFVEPCPPPALARQFRSFFELVWAVPTPESLSCYIKQLPQPFEPSHPELCVLHNDVPFPCAVTIEGVEYASAEHYYQAIRTQCNRALSLPLPLHALLLLPRIPTLAAASSAAQPASSVSLAVALFHSAQRRCLDHLSCVCPAAAEVIGAATPEASRALADRCTIA